MVDQTKVDAFKSALMDKFENKVANKKDDISGDFSTDSVSYPTVKATKEEIARQVQGKVDKVTDKGLSTEDYTSAEKTKLAGIETGANKTTIDSALNATSGNPVQNKVIKSALDGKTNDADLATVAKTGAYSDLTGKPSITVEQQATAESGFLSTYVVKVNNVQVGSKINIPKDYLVKSASVGTVSTANSPVQGFKVGDKYLDFVINSKDASGSDEHLYVLVSDLIDTYTADESTLTLSNNKFSVKNGGITLTKLATSVQTSLGYADNWNSSVAKDITSSDITKWNNKSNLSTSDVDTEIEAYLDALTAALTN